MVTADGSKSLSVAAAITSCAFLLSGESTGSKRPRNFPACLAPLAYLISEHRGLLFTYCTLDALLSIAMVLSTCHTTATGISNLGGRTNRPL
jgi:hypothetical protein